MSRRRIVYRANATAASENGLYSVPIEGSVTTAPLAALTAVRTEATPDGSRVVFLVDQDHVFELFSAPSDGSGPVVALHPALASDQDVADFQLTADGQSVVFTIVAPVQIGAATYTQYSLYSAPLDASSAPIRLSPPLAANQLVGGFDLDPSGQRVLFNAALDAANVFDLYVTSIFGLPAPLKINGALQSSTQAYGQFTADGKRVLYVADLDTPSTAELYLAAPELPFPAVRPR